MVAPTNFNISVENHSGVMNNLDEECDFVDQFFSSTDPRMLDDDNMMLDITDLEHAKNGIFYFQYLFK